MRSMVECEANLATWLKEAFELVLGKDTVDGVKVVPAKDRRFGDYQCNDAMGLAKRANRNPRELSTAALAAVTLPDYVDKAEVAGPGFINLTLKLEALAAMCTAFGQDERCGIAQSGAGQSLVIDYSSPNVAKPMHIGHIRSTVIGNALDRILRSMGYDVIADNHLGDWGTQFGIMIMGYRNFLTDEERARLTVELLEVVYVKSYNEAKEDPSWMQRCREELVKLQTGDEENLAIWKLFIEISKQEFSRIYDRLGVSFDLYRGESYYQPILEETVNILKDRGLATLSEGAWIVDMKDEGLQVAIVRKSDGGFNYTTTDIATVRSRVAEFNPARIVYVTDERQQLHFKQFFAICGKIGVTTQLQHVWFGLMRLPEATFSTRQGNVIKLETLLNEAEARALVIVKASHPDWSAEEQQKLAAAIGISAIKYADLSHDPTTMIVFTWERALALDGNSGPYLQYAHARICSLLDKYAALPQAQDPQSLTLNVTSDVEKALALFVMQFPSAVTRAGDACKPSILADYLYNLCQIYSRFYQSSPVLKSEDAVRDSRIHLCAIVAKVLRKGLTLLGLETPNRI